MDRNDIRARLLEILTSSEFGSLQIDVSMLTDETSLLNDTALDSVQLIELVVAIERAFGIRINTKRLSIDIFDRFACVIDLVEAHLAAAAVVQEPASHVAH